METPWVIAKLSSEHDRSAFSCGKEPLDLFLKTLASQYHKKRLGITYVATTANSAVVCGFYTVATGSISVASLPETSRKHLPLHPIPTLHLGRLAVDASAKGQGLGKTLLFHFLYKAILASEEFGLHTVDVHSKDDESKSFYEKYGFVRLEDEPNHMYLPIKTVEKMFTQKPRR